MSFSKDVACIIAEYLAKYQLLDWIDINKITWDELSANPAAMDLLLANPDKINWVHLSANPSAIELLIANPDKISWDYLSENPHPKAINMLKNHPDKINWYWLSANSGAIDIIKTNMNKIDWSSLSTNPAAIDILIANKHKIVWYCLVLNPAAAELYNKDDPAKAHRMKLARDPKNLIQRLKSNQDKIIWKQLSSNSIIFEYQIDPKLIDKLLEI